MPDNYGIANTGLGTVVNTGAVGSGASVTNYRAAPSVPATQAARDGFDVGVITVLGVELSAVVQVMAGAAGYECAAGSGGRIVHTARLPVPGGPIRMVLVQSTSPGQRAAVAAFDYLREHFAPAVVVLAGIAGGIHPVLRLGDVVIGDEIIYYDLRKVTERGVLRRGSGQPVPALARHMINDFLAHLEPGGLASGHGAFQVLQGPIGSGDAVVAARDSAIRRFLMEYNEKTLALEMEAGGVAQAFHESAGSAAEVKAWLTIRGIADLADQRKDDRYHRIAAQHAAMVLVRMLPHLRIGSGRRPADG